MNTSLFVACAVFAMTCETAHATSLCGQFDPPKVDAFGLQGAVLRLEGADTAGSGTGYLISATQGYVLTAQHVVMQPKEGGIIQATSPLRPGVVFNAEVIDDLKKDGGSVDVALLKIIDPSKLSGLRAVDISLKLPGPGDQLHTMGYPKFGALPNNTLQTALVANPAFSPSSGTIQAGDVNAKPGASGSPLINEFGAAVGTVTQTLGVQEVDAWFIPMASVTPLLDEIKPSDEAIKIESMMKSHSIDQSELKGMLENTNEVSNLDLYELVRLVKADKETSESSRELMRCPISYALDSRGMFDLVIDMQYADAPVKADANLHIAQRDMALGNPVLAITHSQQAIAGYRSFGDSKNIVKGQLILAKAQYQSDTLPQAKETLAAVLANVQALPASDRGEAYLLAGEIDTKRGNLKSARTQFQQASDRFAEQGEFNQAALAKRLTASIDLRQGSTRAAEASTNDAIHFYKVSGNVQGQADLLYEKAKVQAASGDEKGLKSTAEEYIKLSPGSTKAVEMKNVLYEVEKQGGTSQIQ